VIDAASHAVKSMPVTTSMILGARPITWRSIRD